MNRRALTLAILALVLGAAAARPAPAATLVDGSLPSYASPANESFANEGVANAPAAVEVRAVPLERPAAGELVTTSDRGRTWSRSSLDTASRDCPVDSPATTTTQVRCGSVSWKVEHFGGGAGARGYVFGRN
jgi:hypothetical protein